MCGVGTVYSWAARSELERPELQRDARRFHLGPPFRELRLCMPCLALPLDGAWSARALKGKLAVACCMRLGWLLLAAFWKQSWACSPKP